MSLLPRAQHALATGRASLARLGRIQALNRLKRPTETLPEWDRALKLNDHPHFDPLRKLEYALALIRSRGQERVRGAPPALQALADIFGRTGAVETAAFPVKP